MNRLCLVLLAGILLLTGCSPFSITGNRHESGQAVQPSLKVLYGTSEIGSEAVIDSARRYEQITGITIEVNTFSYQNLQGKVMRELAQRSGEYDLIALDSSWIPSILQHLEPLSGYLSAEQGENTIALDDFIPKVFFDAAVFDVRNPQRRQAETEQISLARIATDRFDVYTMPIHVNVPMGTYRKDLFQSSRNQEQFMEQYRRELAVPKTLDEYLDIARFFTRHTEQENLYGTTLMAARSESNSIEFQSFLAAHGGSLLDVDLQPVFQNEAGIQALEQYGSWINTYNVTPPEVLSYTWEEAAIVFGSGQTAMGLNYHVMQLNPKIRAGQKGYFVFPGVSYNEAVQSGPLLMSWGLGINKYSDRKVEAYQLLAYLTGSEAQSTALRFKHHVTRESAYEESGSLLIAADREYYSVLRKSITISAVRPRIIRYNQVSEALQTAIRDYLVGRQDAQTALENAAKQVREIVNPLLH